MGKTDLYTLVPGALMTISYRLTSGFVIMAALLNGAVSAISGNPFAQTPGCGPLELSDVARIAGISAFPLLVLMLLRGIRNRAVPWFLAVVALLALVTAAQSQFSRIAHCQTA